MCTLNAWGTEELVPRQHFIEGSILPDANLVVAKHHTTVSQAAARTKWPERRGPMMTYTIVRPDQIFFVPFVCYAI